MQWFWINLYPITLLCRGESSIEVHYFPPRFRPFLDHLAYTKNHSGKTCMKLKSPIDSVSARDKLKPRDSIYWHKLDRSKHLGFRKLTASSTGTWWARYNDAVSGKQLKKSLGELGDHPRNERFTEAKEAAEKWFSHLGIGGSTKTTTVKDACAEYAEQVRIARGDRAADDYKKRYARWVDNEPIGGIELSKLTIRDVKAWKTKLSLTPAKVNRDDREVPLTRPRDSNTLNRDMAPLRAALNRAKAEGLVSSDLAWKDQLKSAPTVHKPRELYLDRGQRLSLLDAAEPDIRIFLLGMSLLPLRPGALAKLTVGKFDSRLSTLIVGKDKRGNNRQILLPPVTVAALKTAVADKPRTAPIFTRADGKAWNKDSWYDPIKDAAAAAKLPSAVTAYTLRHSVITDLVVSGLDLLTVAQLAGTSVVMIERHYGHLIKAHAADALAKLAL